MKTITQTRLGILGGGQLGRMLIQEAINYNINVSVLDPDANAPCKNLCNKFTIGALNDYDTVYNFGKNLDLITIEIEKVNIEALEQLEKEGVAVYPQPRVIRLIQDKGLQKQFFKLNDIPTADFELIQSIEQLQATTFDFPLIQKIRKDGYDGKGVVKINHRNKLENAFTAPSIIEQCIDFEKEVAVIVSRNQRGEIATFPMVEMDFNPEANLVEFLISPSQYPEAIQQQAQQIATEIIVKLNMVGLLAVEMFLTKEGNLLVNELAPRPHNSGHQSIEGNYTSQFAQHLRAIFNLPLGDTKTIAHAVMINLLGENGYEGIAQYQGLEKILSLPGIYVHLYGKMFTKPFRKMGHVTILDDDRAQAISKAKFVQQTLKVIA